MSPLSGCKREYDSTLNAVRAVEKRPACGIRDQTQQRKAVYITYEHELHVEFCVPLFQQCFAVVLYNLCTEFPRFCPLFVIVRLRNI